MKSRVTIQAVVAALGEARRHISEEISRYPAPITACDAQFNHLLSQRARITRELARLQSPDVADWPAEQLDACVSELLSNQLLDEGVLRRFLPGLS